MPAVVRQLLRRLCTTDVRRESDRELPAELDRVAAPAEADVDVVAVHPRRARGVGRVDVGLYRVDIAGMFVRAEVEHDRPVARVGPVERLADRAAREQQLLRVVW